MDNAACGLLQTEDDGVIRWVNRLFCEWIGVDETALIGRRKIQELFTIGGRIFHQTHWVPLIRIQQSVSEVKFDVLHADGHTIPMVINGIRRVRGNAVVHDLAVFIARDRDTYERELVNSGKRLKELVARSAELEEAARDRAAFAEQILGIVSHDLRNPLATVELSAMAVLSGSTNPEHRAALMRITRATARATRLIHDLLDFTQARLGKGLSVQRTNVHVHEVIAESIADLRHTYPTRTLIHETQGSGSCDADADRLMQLIGNLVTNAITYGMSGTPVKIVSALTDSHCAISVHNEGNPIREEIVADLFQPMARGENIPSERRSVGLGLYIVREIAKAHGGDVSVVSRTNTGTTFTVEFPRASGEVDARVQAPRPE
ncbi:MAG: HAMP domain-containing sensor histidine kinase [Gemmatimonadaceae bacterium]